MAGDSRRRYHGGQKCSPIWQAAKTGKPATATPPTRSLSRHKISLRARTLNGEKLKVNDKRGNPVEIAAIVIWRVEDTAQASFRRG